jgi:hypothetical protein
MSPSVVLAAPPLRILNPQEAQERARNRLAWGELWQAIAREANADHLDEPRDDDEKATAEDSAAA